MNRPFFIVFEGIDGSGKSTQARKLFRYFESIDLPVINLIEPSEGDWGRKIRRILTGKQTPLAEDMLKFFIKDREDDVLNNIIPALKNNKSIIMDRYYYSNVAYQGAMGLSPEYVLEQNRKRNFPIPDRVYYIDISPEQAMMRIRERNGKGESELFEKSLFLKKVREIYLSTFSEDKNFLFIDGSGDIEDIFDIIIKDIKGEHAKIRGDK